MEEFETQYPQKINSLCGISSRHIVGPFSINGNLTSDRYLQLLQQSLIPRLFPYPHTLQNPVFQQDNAQPHIGGATLKRFEETEVNLLPCLPKSSDLSPIENV